MAFSTAHELGADGIEFDVHATRDGALVVHHDYLLGRTNEGVGAIYECDAEYVRSLDGGSWFANEFAGERVPLLAEVLNLRNFEFELELKGFGRKFFNAVLEQVDLSGVADRTEITSWNIGMLLALKKERPTARVGLFSRPRPPWMPQDLFVEHIVGNAEFLPFDVAHVYAANVDRQVVERLHRLGMSVHANDARGEEDLIRAVEAGVDRMSCDDVALALRVAGIQR